ncbi:MAG: hypothetical protein QNJ45_27030 [Ardenticatenaceae bacterium]|nr:hypothetical protein [Ardenticatenaceae bacterium]
MQTIIVHINSEDPVMGEVDELPGTQDQLIMLQNPRRRDGKDVHYIDEDVNVIIIPFHRVNFIQILPTADAEEIIGFVRE